jgi:lysophospholipase L1-like esterase
MTMSMTKPRKDLFVDGPHLSPKGYALWTVVVQPFLDEQQH